ncbi:uncharacterized protein [Lolium perenne]|uniref:uncharacterized protein n=1 Tax=Lolium perenne TaxID=4522 RepID=UPI0021EA5B63|nr:uncharacterized protein LOC127333587 [Lolium perenne]
MHPRNHRSQSARPRGRNSAPWGVVPAETLLDPTEEPSRSENDGSGGSRKRTRSDQGRCSTPPCRASTRTKKKPRRYSSEEVETEFRGCLDPKNRGRRSVRPRGNKPAGTSWAMSLDGFLNLGTAASSTLQSGGSEKMESTPRDADAAKVEENRGAAIEQGNGAGANCADKQLSVAADSITSLDTKGRNHGGDNVAAELKVSNGTYANSVVQTIVPATDTLPHLKESNRPGADALHRTAVQTNNDFDPLKLKDRANDAAGFDSKTVSGLVLENGNVEFDLSSAESALASLYGESDRDTCIEFAVKILMNETPLPKEAVEIQEFFAEKIHCEKRAMRQRQEGPNKSCSVWANFQSDKLQLASRC